MQKYQLKTSNFGSPLAAENYLNKKPERKKEVPI